MVSRTDTVCYDLTDLRTLLVVDGLLITQQRRSSRKSRVQLRHAVHSGGVMGNKEIVEGFVLEVPRGDLGGVKSVDEGEIVRLLTIFLSYISSSPSSEPARRSSPSL